MPLRSCLDCGRPTSNGSRCPEDAAAKLAESRPKRYEKEKGRYDAAWRRLSIRMRKAQPWCSKCGKSEDLTLDHVSDEAYERQAQGLALRARDVRVLCRACNTAEARNRNRTSPDYSELMG